MRYNTKINRTAIFDIEEYLGTPVKFHKDLFGAQIVFKFKDTEGVIMFPDIRRGLSFPLYASWINNGEHEMGVVYDSRGHFELGKICIGFADDTSMCKDFFVELRDKIALFLDLMSLYKNGVYIDNQKLSLSKSMPNVLNGVVYADSELKKEPINLSVTNFAMNMIAGDIYIINKRILKAMLSVLKSSSINASTAHQLIRQARVYYKNHELLVCIILCCTTVEVVISGVLRKNNIEIPADIKGISELMEIAKENGIKKMKGFDHRNLAGLRNKAAHAGISPTSKQCEHYMRECKRFIEYHRVKFYQI